MQGFYQDDPRKAELFWYQGGHGAVFNDTNAIESLAAYVLEKIGHDEYVHQPDNLLPPEKGPNGLFSFLSRTARFHFVVLLTILVIWVFYVLALTFGWDVPSVDQMLAWITSESRSREIAIHLAAIAALVIGLDYL